MLSGFTFKRQGGLARGNVIAKKCLCRFPGERVTLCDVIYSIGKG